MTAPQTSRNTSIIYAPQAAIGTPALAADPALVFPFNSGAAGLSRARTPIRSNRNRRDGQSNKGRGGSVVVNGGLPAELSLGAFDTPFAALVRGNWQAALTVDQTTGGVDLVSGITTEANAIVGASGSFITQGLREGDVIVLSGHSSAGNNGRDLHITRIPNPTRIEVLETLTANAVNDTTYSILRPRKLVNPAVPVRQLFTFEQKSQDIGKSKLYRDCRFVSCRVSMAPNGMVGLDFTVLGRNLHQVNEAGTYPYFTNVTDIDTLSLTAADAKIVLGSGAARDVVALTNLDFTVSLGGQVDPLIGSNEGSDVAEGNMQPIEGSFGVQEKDYDIFNDHMNETAVQLMLHLTEPDADPKDFFNIMLLDMVLGFQDGPLGNDGSKTDTVPFESGKNFDATASEEAAMIKLQTSYV